MDYGVSVAFGRNVGSVPMLDVEWDSFQTDVLGVLRDVLTLAGLWDSVGVESVEGSGVWAGVAEDCARLTVFGLSADNAEMVADGVADWLGSVARNYRQEAIAVSVMRTHFVEGV